MPDDIWSSGPPTEPGDYFWRRKGELPHGFIRIKLMGDTLWALQAGEKMMVQLATLERHLYEYCPVDPPGAVRAERERCAAVVRATEPEGDYVLQDDGMGGRESAWQSDAERTLESAAKRIESGVTP